MGGKERHCLPTESERLTINMQDVLALLGLVIKKDMPRRSRIAAAAVPSELERDKALVNLALKMATNDLVPSRAFDMLFKYADYNRTPGWVNDLGDGTSRTVRDRECLNKQRTIRFLLENVDEKEAELQAEFVEKERLLLHYETPGTPE